MVDRPDVESPVEGYERAGEDEHEVLPRTPDVVAETHAAQAYEEGDHEDSRPEHAVGEYLETVDVVEEPPVEREHAPDGVAQEAVEEAFFVGGQGGEGFSVDMLIC